MEKSKPSVNGPVQIFLDHMATEERRNRIRAEVTDDPGQKEHSRRKARQIRKMIERVENAAAGGMETADIREWIDGETPEEAQSV